MLPVTCRRLCVRRFRPERLRSDVCIYVPMCLEARGIPHPFNIDGCLGLTHDFLRLGFLK